MTTDEFKHYQRTLNHIRENKLKEGALPTSKQLLEPDVKLTVDISDLTIDNIPINITPPVNPVKEEKAIKSNSKSLF
mgnify:CR=1 FL=1